MPVFSPTASGAFRHPGFARYWLARFLGSFSAQIIGVAVGWQVYDITRDPFDLGIIGLVQFLPGRFGHTIEQRETCHAPAILRPVCVESVTKRKLDTNAAFISDCSSSFTVGGRFSAG